MFTRWYSLLLVCIILAFKADQFILIQSIPAVATTITTDHLGNLYILKKDVLEKYDRDGKFLRSYNDKKLGAISSVDASNPMRIVVYYASFLQVVFLDNTLSVNGTPAQLTDLGLQQTSLVAASHDNCLWVYDRQNSELLRLNKSMQIVQRSGPITQFVDYTPNPVFLMEYDNFIYLNDPEHGILLFDIYATMYSTVPLKNLNNIQVIGKSIAYTKENKFKRYDYKLLTEEEIVLPDSVTNARIEKERLYTFKPAEVKIYSVKE